MAAGVALLESIAFGTDAFMSSGPSPLIFFCSWPVVGFPLVLLQIELRLNALAGPAASIALRRRSAARAAPGRDRRLRRPAISGSART